MLIVLLQRTSLVKPELVIFPSETVLSRFHCCRTCDYTETTVVEPEQISFFTSVMQLLFFLSTWNYVLILVKSLNERHVHLSHCSFNHLSSTSFQTWHTGPRTQRRGIRSGSTANDWEQRFVWAEWLSKWGDPRIASEEKRGWVPMARAIHTHAPHASGETPTDSRRW